MEFQDRNHQAVTGDAPAAGRSTRGRRSDRQGDHAIQIGPAESFSQLCEAFHLVYEEYLKSGYIAPSPARMRYSVRELLPCSRTFVATLGGTVIGTGTMVLASPAGLPSDEVFGDVLASLERAGRRVAESTMLACANAESVQAQSLTVELIPWGLAWAMGQRADDWCITVNPKHLRFWHRTLGLEVAGEPRQCDHVGGHPGILLRLPLREIRAGACEVTPFFQRRILSRLPAEALASGLELTVEEVAVLLVRQPELVQDLTESQRAMLLQYHPKAFGLAEHSAFHSSSAPFATAA